MKLSDEQIASIMTQNVACKTILVDPDKVESEVESHKKDGWILVSKNELNGRFKLTFKKQN